MRALRPVPLRLLPSFYGYNYTEGMLQKCYIDISYLFHLYFTLKHSKSQLNLKVKTNLENLYKLKITTEHKSQA